MTVNETNGVKSTFILDRTFRPRWTGSSFFLAGKGRTSPTGAVVNADSEPTALVAAPGRVEPVSEEIKISGELGGNIKSVMVEDGDRVHQGRAIAVLKVKF